MNRPNNATIVDLGTDADSAHDDSDFANYPGKDDFLDGRQEGLYEACLIVDKVAAQHGHHEAVAEALDAMRILIRQSLHTTDPEEIRARVNALAAAAATRS